ncbi:MAG: DNA repair protein RadC [Chitinophagaceae bacterium]
MQAQKYSIKDWALDDQPREKLYRKSPAALSDSELLAIIINQGTRETSAVQLAKDVLALGKNDLNTLGKLSVRELMSIKGMGFAKAVKIAAALELRRRSCVLNLEKDIFRESRDVANYLRSRFKDHTNEVFGVLFLNQGNRINHFEILSTGGITSTVADPRIVFKKALLENAVSIILCHNHPSGSLKPSRSDIELTRNIIEAGKYLDIQLLDHIIVSEEGYYSFADEGLI